MLNSKTEWNGAKFTPNIKKEQTAIKNVIIHTPLKDRRISWIG